jgi:hypothetical protein
MFELRSRPLARHLHRTDELEVVVVRVGHVAIRAPGASPIVYGSVTTVAPAP